MLTPDAEYFDIVACYLVSHRNAAAALRMYRDRYLNRRQPSDKTVTRLAMHLRIFRAFYPSKGTAIQPHPVHDTNRDEVLRLVQKNVHTSSRAIGAELNISHSTVLKILKNMQFYPFKLHLHQALPEADYPLRLNFDH